MRASGFIVATPLGAAAAIASSSAVAAAAKCLKDSASRSWSGVACEAASGSRDAVLGSPKGRRASSRDRMPATRAGRKGPAIARLWGRRRLDIHGVGAWPPAGGAEPGPEWVGFMRAVHRLAGGRGFDARQGAEVA